MKPSQLPRCILSTIFGNSICGPHTEATWHGILYIPGMFDDYLEKQDELGSAADTNAKLQYKAAMGSQQKKVGSPLTCYILLGVYYIKYLYSIHT